PQTLPGTSNTGSPSQLHQSMTQSPSGHSRWQVWPGPSSTQPQNRSEQNSSGTIGQSGCSSSVEVGTAVTVQSVGGGRSGSGGRSSLISSPSPSPSSSSSGPVELVPGSVVGPLVLAVVLAVVLDEPPELVPSAPSSRLVPSPLGSVVTPWVSCWSGAPLQAASNSGGATPRLASTWRRRSSRSECQSMIMVFIAARSSCLAGGRGP